MSDDIAAGRSQHMHDGRRVTLADLVKNGLLDPGANLVFHRPRVGETYTATISERGNVLLDDGQEFASVTRAASMCLGGTPGGDGWYAWRVGSPSGPRLDDIRQQLLDKSAAADEDIADRTAPTPAQGRHGFLRDARAKAEAGTPVTLPVRELISLWGKKGRGSRVRALIDADLANHGLVTSPGFSKVTLDATVVLVLASVDDEVDTGTKPVASAAVFDEAEELDVGLTVGNLPSALGGVDHVAPTATFEEAITVMLLNDYSQLAVQAGSHTLRGAVTWRSIATKRHSNPDARLADAIVPAHEVRYDQELVDILPILADSDFVIVRDQNRAIAGIVTTADVATAYGETATPFLLIGELDQHLRWLVTRSFSIADVVTCCDSDGSRGITTHDDLTFGDYLRIFESTENWTQLGWPLDRAAFVRRLDEIREIRNDVMHFNPDPLPADTVDKLRHLLKLLREYGT